MDYKGIPSDIQLYICEDMYNLLEKWQKIHYYHTVKHMIQEMKTMKDDSVDELDLDQRSRICMLGRIYREDQEP